MDSIRKSCSITSCPFSFTEESEQAQNYGCLPSPYEIVQMRIYHNKTWACHSRPNKPCIGALKHLKENNFQYKVVDNQLVTEKDDWSKYISK